MQLKLMILIITSGPISETRFQHMPSPCDLTWTTKLLLWLLSKRHDIGSLQFRTQQEYLKSCWQQSNKRH
jgi:hypothetical protein